MTSETHTIHKLSHQDLIEILTEHLEVPKGAEVSGEIGFANDDFSLAELLEIRIDVKHKQ